jgi:glutathione S-transferase
MPDTATANSATARTETADDRTLVIERVFKAPPEAVFRAWTDPAILVQWWGPEAFKTAKPEMDVRPGGAWRTVMVGPKGEYTASGIYREITPPKRLVMSWAWQQDDGSRGHETEIEVSFEAAGEGTKMRLVQRVFQSREQRDNHFGGWASSFNDLERLFA